MSPAHDSSHALRTNARCDCVHSNHWKSRDRVGHVYTIGNDSVLAAYRAKALCEPLLRALVAANIERHGPDHAAVLSARVVLGETLAAAACVSMDSPTDGRLVRWGTVPTSDADAVLMEALASVRRSKLLLTSTAAARVLSAYAGCLSQQGLFARSAVLLRELLEAFVLQDGGYTDASFGSCEAGLGNQIQALARHTQKAGAEACMAGAELLRVHSTALRNYQDTGEYNLRLLYYEADARLLLSHCRRAEGGVLLAEAEVLARELVTQRKHAWDLAPLSKLLKVLEAQVALGRMALRLQWRSAARPCAQSSLQHSTQPTDMRVISFLAFKCAKSFPVLATTATVRLAAWRKRMRIGFVGSSCASFSPAK